MGHQTDRADRFVREVFGRPSTEVPEQPTKRKGPSGHETLLRLRRRRNRLQRGRREG